MNQSGFGWNNMLMISWPVFIIWVHEPETTCSMQEYIDHLYI
jgi:hypothetical protein